jgi:hypothetical protein
MVSRGVRYSICNAMRELLLESRGNRCEECRSEFRLDVHHKRYRVPCRTNDFLVLCESCHQSQDHKDIKEMRPRVKEEE